MPGEGVDRARLTLGAAAALALLLLVAGGGAVIGRLLFAWRSSLLDAAAELRESASRRVAATVAASLAEAEGTVNAVEAQLAAGVIHAGDPLSVEGGLLSPLLDNERLAEVALTRGPAGGRAAEQVSVYRVPHGGIETRRTYEERGRFVSDLRARPPGLVALTAAPLRRESRIPVDPSLHPTFVTTAAPERHGRLIWSDLHYSELDAHLPERQRRVVVTALKAVPLGEGTAVLRVALLPEALDRMRAIRVDESDPRDPHRVFLCDSRGRLVTRLAPDDLLEESDGDLRIAASGAPPEVQAALREPALAALTDAEPSATVRLTAGGRAYLARFQALPGTQDWRVAIVGPEDHYLAGLQQARRRLIVESALVTGLLLVLGALVVTAVRRGLRRIVDGTGRMSAFDFAPASPRSAFRDVGDVLTALELAKTAMRAMSRYVPVALVRALYVSRREPVLGGELREVSMMFTDIEGFTGISERLGPDALAAALGRYLEVMTDAIHRTGGIVDKYVGDAVMALWNAPVTCADHAVRACEAALSCADATRALMSSPEWGERPVLFTRFGLHRDTVMVGHFGAPDRMAYTALGDGVNLSSRLESLNKQYGTWILASESMRDAAGPAFLFRLVDRVAVKGKTRGVAVYELLGRASELSPDHALNARAYEQAFAAYQDRRFLEAIDLLRACQEDLVARGLQTRCLSFIATPPPADWDGVWHARDK